MQIFPFGDAVRSNSSLHLSGVLPGKMIFYIHLFFEPHYIRKRLLLLFLGNLHLGYDRFNHVGGESFARIGEGGSA